MSDRSPVRLTLDTTLADSEFAEAMGRMYLPDDDIGNRYALEGFTWLPTDADLAALPFPLAPDTDAITEGLPADIDNGPSAYYAQVVLAEIPEEVNAGGEGLGFVAGTITAMDFRINAGTVSVDLALSRRLPRPNSEQFGVTYADIGTGFPAVDYDDVDTDLSYYDLRLAHP